MSIDNSSDDELPLSTPLAPPVDEAIDDDDFDDWEVPSNVAPCAVYPEGPHTLGRVTTPLGDLSVSNHFGSMVPMMRELGRRSASEMREGALFFLGRYSTEIATAGIPDMVAGIGRWVVDHWMIQRLHDALPATYLKMLQAFAEGSGHDVEQVLAAQLSWDIWALCSQSSSRSVRAAAEKARRYSPLLGSATVVLPTAKSGPLHLRWLDNSAIDRWDRKTSVTFFHPDRGIPYALVSSVGFLTGLPAGMNSAGLTVSVEPGTGTSVHWDHTPLGWATHQILRQAHTIEQAASILRQHPPIASWRYVICEGDTGRAAIFEAGEVVEQWHPHLRPPFSACTGEATSPTTSYDRSRRWHERRQKELDRLLNHWGTDSDDDVFRALQAMTSPDITDHNGSGHPLSGLSNVSALIFEPAQRRLWVAAGRAPSARRWFVPLCLRHADGSGSGGGLDTRVRPLTMAGVWEKSGEGRAVDHLRHAYQLELANEDDERILITVEHALALDSRRPDHHVLAGLLALRIGRNRRAEGAFERAFEMITEPARRAEIRLYLAWALDLQRRRREARKLYRRITRDPDAQRPVRRRARRGRRRRFRRRNLRKLQFDFLLATVISA